ncbi:hypothetical protein CHUAL_004473 [Chamberlinius hualienensis]
MDSEDERWAKIAEKNEEWLLPMKEDVADWLNRTLGERKLNAGNLMDILDNGAVLCRLAKKIHHQGSLLKKPLGKVIPPFTYKCWENAQSRSFFARDNAANFLRWCRECQINEAVLFESEDLVLHTQPRLVILCLLELGRLAAKCGIDPPGLVKLEKEIDERIAEETKLTLRNGKSTGIRKGTPAFQGRVNRAASDVGFDRPSPSSSSSASPDNSLVKLHARVLKFTQTHKDALDVKKVADGKYLIAGKIVFLRLLNDCHVMVRVGGGWDTLEHFVARHDPHHNFPSCSTVNTTPVHSARDDVKCRTRRLRRSASSPSPKTASLASASNPLGLFI